MAVMTAQAPLPLTPAGAVEIGAVVALVEDAEGSGRVYVRGELAYLWGPGDQIGRRLAAVQLMQVKQQLMLFRQLERKLGYHPK